MMKNNHFISVSDWNAAKRLLSFKPIVPSFTANCDLLSLEVYLKDHRGRQISIEKRSLEANYSCFILEQKSLNSVEQAENMIWSNSYDSLVEKVSIADLEGKAFEFSSKSSLHSVANGKELSIIVWNELNMFYFLASNQLDLFTLKKIASSMVEENE